MIRAKVNTADLARKFERFHAELPHAKQEKFDALARECLAQIKRETMQQRRDAIARALERQFRAIFVPVIVQHRRREQWPDLRLIYRQRILLRRSTYMGRKRFYVDQAKEEQLFAELLGQATAKLKDEEFIFRLTATSDRRWRLEIVRRDGQDTRDTAVMIAYAKQRFRQVTEETLQTALTRAGLR